MCTVFVVGDPRPTPEGAVTGAIKGLVEYLAVAEAVAGHDLHEAHLAGTPVSQRKAGEVC